MRPIKTGLALTLLAMAAPLAGAQAQTADPHHPGSSAPSTQTSMQMPDTTARSGQPGAMGAGMGRMMEAMHPMMAERGGMGMPFEHVEGRIAYLKAELKVTNAQTAPWDAFADTMRADATAMKTMHDGMMKDGIPSTTPGRMAAQHKMMSARIGILERSEASTRALYASLSEDQRKAFDQLMVDPSGIM